MKKTLLTLGLALAVAAPLGANAAGGGCTGTGAAWPTYGGDVENTRDMPSSITAENAGTLKPIVQIPTTGVVQNTPVLAQGCIYLASDAGVVSAHDAETGAQAWTLTVPGPFGGYGGSIIGSPLYEAGKLYVAINRATTPSLLILDATDGTVIADVVVDNWKDNFGSASPVLAGDFVFYGISGAEGTDHARGGYAFVELDGTPIDLRPFDDTTTAAYTISDAEYAAGYRGTSIWTTAAYSPAEKAIYAGGGNPASKKIEHRYSNALLKIDADRSSPTFGQIIDAYKGDTDQYYPGLDRQPLCDLYGDDITYLAWSAACLQLDLDFGASPNLWIDAVSGRPVIGALQKSGVYHAVWADNMQAHFATAVGVPCFACNASTSAVDDKNVYVVGAPGVIHAISNDSGRVRWATPVGDGLRFQSVSVTNDVVLATTTHGFMLALDAADGTILYAGRRITGGGTGNSSSGVAIDGDRLFAPLANAVVIYELS